jgi:hypothetical protein
VTRAGLGLYCRLSKVYAAAKFVTRSTVSSTDFQSSISYLKITRYDLTQWKMQKQRDCPHTTFPNRRLIQRSDEDEEKTTPLVTLHNNAGASKAGASKACIVTWNLRFNFIFPVASLHCSCRCCQHSTPECDISGFLSLVGKPLPVQQLQSFLVGPLVSTGYDLSWTTPSAVSNERRSVKSEESTGHVPIPRSLLILVLSRKNERDLVPAF